MLISVAMRSGGVSSSLQDSEFWGGLEEKEFHIVFFRGSFLAERGPRGVPVILDIHHFGGLVTMKLRRMAVCWISNVDSDRYAIPRDIHEETARSAQSYGWVGLMRH